MAGASTIQHGYVQYKRGCRCKHCTAANTEHARKARALKASGAVHIPDHVHGTRNGFDHWRCHCPPCVEAKRAASRAYDHTHIHKPRSRA